MFCLRYKVFFSAPGPQEAPLCGFTSTRNFSLRLDSHQELFEAHCEALSKPEAPVFRPLHLFASLRSFINENIRCPIQVLLDICALTGSRNNRNIKVALFLLSLIFVFL